MDGRSNEESDGGCETDNDYFGIKKNGTLLRRHLNAGGATKKLGRFRRVFSIKFKQKICVLYGLTKETLQDLA